MFVRINHMLTFNQQSRQSLQAPKMTTKVAIALALAMSAVQPATALPAQGGKFIVGGEEAKAGDFPFIVSILINGTHDCGGTLLNANTVLTAAHCSKGHIAGRQVRAGSLVST